MNEAGTDREIHERLSSVGSAAARETTGGTLCDGKQKHIHTLNPPHLEHRQTRDLFPGANGGGGRE